MKCQCPPRRDYNHACVENRLSALPGARLGSLATIAFSAGPLGELRFDGDNSDNGASCSLHIQILDQAGEMAFKGQTVDKAEAASGRAAKDVLVLAFEEASQLMCFPDAYE